MRFDYVIGNPPYNNDIYLEFVINGQEVCRNSCIMITPAKWLGKAGSVNNRFRADTVPYMSKIVYYPDCTDVFNISEPDGITYYKIDKVETSVKTIINKSNKLCLDEVQERPLGYHLLNKANTIINKVKQIDNNSFMFNTTRSYFVRPKQVYKGTEGDHDAVVIGGNSRVEKLVYGYVKGAEVLHPEDIGKYKAVMSFKIGSNCGLDNTGKVSVINPIKVLGPGEICKDDYLVLRVSDNQDEIQHLISYLSTKFIRFLLWLGNNGDNSSNLEFWRFVPVPKDLTRPYTDKYLYNKFSMTTSEVQFIESIVKYI